MVPTFFTNLALGSITVMVAQIITLATWITGSVIIPGNIFLDTTNNATPDILLNQQAAITFQADGDVEFGSGDLVFNSTRNTAMCTKTSGGNFIECYQEDVFTGTGGGFGTASYYNVASIEQPYVASGAITRVGIDCDGQPVTANVSVGLVAATTSSGTDFINKYSVSSGATKYWTGSGATKPWYNATPYIKASASADLAQDDSSSNCLLRVWSFGTYNPT